MTRTLLALSAGLALIVGPVQATTIITFETLPGGTPITGMTNSPGAAVPVASRLDDQFLLSDGVSFSSGAGYAAVVDHVPGCALCTPTPPNIVGGTNANGTLNYGAPLTAAFFSTANPTIRATTNYVRVLGELVPDGTTLTLEAYGLTGNLLGSVSQNEGGTFGVGADLSLSLAGIHAVRFYGNSGTGGFDNFEFGDLQAVPEPATWALMIGGFGLVGGVVRRRHAAAAA